MLLERRGNIHTNKKQNNHENTTNKIKKRKEKDIPTEKDLFLQANKFSKSYQKTTPGTNLLTYAQKKNIRALSYGLNKIKERDPQLYKLLTKNEKKIFYKDENDNLTKLTSNKISDSEKREILLYNPTLTDTAIEFFSGLNVIENNNSSNDYNDEEELDEEEEKKLWEKEAEEVSDNDNI